MKKLFYFIHILSLLLVGSIAYGEGIADKSIGGIMDVLEAGDTTEVLMGGGAGNAPVWSASAGGTGYWTQSGTNLYYNTGNVGIGTTAPGAKLEVAGQVKITGGAPGAGKVLTSDANGLASWGAGGGNLGATSSKTAGALTITLADHNLSITGNVTSINTTSGSCPDGYIVVLRRLTSSAAFTQVATAYIRLQTDFYFSTQYSTLTLMSLGSGYWVEIARADNV